MTRQKADEQAFPSQELNSDGSHYHGSLGLTKREYFAAKAMQGMLADGSAKSGCDLYARAAVEFADALLAAMEKATP